jgi:hypothetical protein
MTWLLRALGLVLWVAALYLLLAPVAELISFLPLLDDLLKSAFFVVALLGGLAASAFTIACAWVVARPLAAAALFALIGGGMLAAQGGFATTGAVVSVGLVWGLAAVELVVAAAMAIQDCRYEREMAEQLAQIEKRGAEP